MRSGTRSVLKTRCFQSISEYPTRGRLALYEETPDNPIPRHYSIFRRRLAGHRARGRCGDHFRGERASSGVRLRFRRTQGWRAAESGQQTIRLVFDQSQRLKQISLVFEENEIARTKEFVLRWSSDGGSLFREIVRQQWNFSPPQTAREVRNIKLSFQASPYSNCRSCRIRVADLLAPRSRVCSCLEVVIRLLPNTSRG